MGDGGHSSGSWGFEALLVAARDLWSLADLWVRFQNARNDELTSAAKDWSGPHMETFFDQLAADYVDEYALENSLRAAANNMARAWVDAMNDSNRKAYDRAVEQADSSWEWLPGVSDAPVLELTPITVAPSGPGFVSTGGYYENTLSVG